MSEHSMYSKQCVKNVHDGFSKWEINRWFSFFFLLILFYFFCFTMRLLILVKIFSGKHLMLLYSLIFSRIMFHTLPCKYLSTVTSLPCSRLTKPLEDWFFFIYPLELYASWVSASSSVQTEYTFTRNSK